jgi:hypothetical protein
LVAWTIARLAEPTKLPNVKGAPGNSRRAQTDALPTKVTHSHDLGASGQRWRAP